MSKTKPPVIANPWQSLRRFTPARIALGRSGVSQPTAPQLAFQLAHAMARDAVQLALDAEAFAQRMASTFAHAGLTSIALKSAAETRDIYLQRPDLGRRLNADSRCRLESLARPDDADERPYGIALVVADGLSALAIEQNAEPFLKALMTRLDRDAWSYAPIAVVEQGRVAIGDEIGELFGAQVAVVLIGERPGLSSPDSMGLYMTWAPRAGLTDESRNCISNVRPAGLRHEEAAAQLASLLAEARRRRLSGVALKVETADAIRQPAPDRPASLP